MKSKTIILSSQNEGKGRGILTIYDEDDLLKCKLRLYNIDGINRYCKLGVYHNDEVFSGNLLEKGGVYTSSMVGNFDMEKDFYTAVIDTSQNNKVLLSGGTYAGFFFNDNGVFENTNSKHKQSHIFDNVEKENPNTDLFDYEHYKVPSLVDNLNTSNNNIEEDSTIESTPINFEECIDLNDSSISINSPCDADNEKCKHCKYKEYFYSHQQNLTTNTQSSIEKCTETQPSELQSKQEDEKENSSILASIIPQFQYVFDNYQADETLNKLIPNGRFAQIHERNDHYSIGAIYKDEEMKYICYAVFKPYNSPAPQELGEHYQWLPLDKEDPLSDGYFIVFQDANDLKIVEL